MTKGLAKPLTVAVLVPFMVAMTFIVPISNKLGEHPTMHIQNLRVIEPVGDWAYWMRTDAGQRIYVSFCKDLGFEPPFDSGETIKEMNVKNYGDCWSLHGQHPAYIMQRDRQGNLTKED